MNQNPIVSIIIPVYNGANYLRQAIDSALSQTYRNIEVIVVNDGSNDGGKTEEIALSYGEKIRYFNKLNGGVSSALNLGIKNMKGEFFSWLSHDDIYTPDKIEKQLKYANRKTLVLCSTLLIDKDSQPIKHRAKRKNNNLLSWQEAMMYITRYSANGCAFLIPKESFEEVGLFDESLRYCQDILMWWNIFLAHYSLQLTEDIGVYTRIHEQQVSRVSSNLYSHDANYIGNIIPSKMAKMVPGSNACLYEYTKQEAIRGNRDVVSKSIEKAKDNKRFTFSQRTIIQGLSVYGKIRPLIRELYYKTICKSNAQNFGK